MTLRRVGREILRGGPFYGTYVVVLAYLVGVVGLPVGLVLWTAVRDGPGALAAALLDAEARAAFRLSLEAAAAVTLANAVLGTATAYALVRLRFPGRGLVDALVDVPLALPTAVTGLMIAAIGGERVLYRPAGVYAAVAAVSLPFVVRAVAPLLHALDEAEVEAAGTLGAGPVRTFFAVVLPAIRPGILAGAALSFARALGEFGAVILVAGATPFRTEVAATLVYARLEAFDFRGASAAAAVVLVLSYGLLLAARLIERKTARRPA